MPIKAKDVETYLYDVLPESSAGPVVALINGLVLNHSTDGEGVEAGEEQQAPRSARRAAPANQDDDEAPRSSKRRAAPTDNDDDEEETKPRSGRRTAPTDQDEGDSDLLADADLVPTDEDGGEEETAPRSSKRRAAPTDDDEEETKPRKRRAVEDEAPAKPAKRSVTKPTFKALELDGPTVKGYINDYLGYANAKAIKVEVAENLRVQLSGSDMNVLAKQAAYIYEADVVLQEMSLADLQKQATSFGLEPDLTGKRNESSKKLVVIDAIIEACLDNLAV